MFFQLFVSEFNNYLTSKDVHDQIACLGVFHYDHMAAVGRTVGLCFSPWLGSVKDEVGLVSIDPASVVDEWGCENET